MGIHVMRDTFDVFGGGDTFRMVHFKYESVVRPIVHERLGECGHECLDVLTHVVRTHIEKHEFIGVPFLFEDTGGTPNQRGCVPIDGNTMYPVARENVTEVPVRNDDPIE